MTNPLLLRQAATERTLALYRGKLFNWRRGITCVHLARRHLRHMGHNPPTVPRIRSVLSARRALAARGWDSTADMLDSLLPRIAPAQMLLGDIATAPGLEGLDAIVICAGPRKLMGWHETAEGLVVIDIGPGDLLGAWRVEPQA